MTRLRGLSCPVLIPESIDWQRDYADVTLDDLLAMPDERLAEVDPLAMNLIVAKRIPTLAHLDIACYQGVINDWVADFQQRCLPRWEPYFYEAPGDFEDDIRFFRLGMVCQYLELEIGLEYNVDQQEAKSVLYTNPSDLFLNGVLDTRQGTCGNMAALQFAIGWRLGWPVSLACVNSHYILRFDDGQTIYNIEATQAGYGGFKSDPDEYLIQYRKLPLVATRSGSDLRALRPREILGAFIGLRARHTQDIGKRDGDEAKMLTSEADWLLARQLFPTSRVLYKNQLVITSMRGDTLFESNEAGHPNTYSACLDELRFHRDHCWDSNRHVSGDVSKIATQEAIDELSF